MGNDPSKNIVLIKEWSPEHLSTFMLSMNSQQTQIVFGEHQNCNLKNISYLLQESIALYLLNVNMKRIQNAKVEQIKAKIVEYQKTGQIEEEIGPMLKYIVENKMKGNYQTLEMLDFASVVGTWVLQYKSLMDAL